MKHQLPVRLRILRTLTHTLYPLSHTGLPRLADWLRRRVATQYLNGEAVADFWINDFMGHLNFCCDLRDHMGGQIFFRGAHSHDQLELIKTVLPAGSVFIDIGANQGEFSVFTGSLSADNQVLAFEPTVAMRARLSANIAGNNLHNVQVFDFGLSNESRDDVPIYGGAGVFEDGTVNSGLPTIFAIPKRTQLLEHIRLRTLDDTLHSLTPKPQVDLLKIDVEGAELPVLEGAQQTIAASRPLIIFEASQESTQAAGYSVGDLYAWLEAADYELHQIGASGRLSNLNRQQEYCNVLGVPKEKSQAFNNEFTALRT